MSTKPKISVIIGVLNMASWIDSAIQSVIDQKYSNFELIILDAGSTDGTIEIIKKHAAHITYWHSKKDKGHPDACNQAIDIATGDLIVFLNADDFFGLGLFDKVAEKFIHQPNLDMVTCGVRIIGKNAHNEFHTLTELTQADKLQLTFTNMLFELTAFNARFYRKSLFTRFGKFNTHDADGHVYRSNDREFLLRLALNNISSEIITEPLYTYLSHQAASSFSKKNRVRIHSEHLSLAEKLLNDNDLSAEKKKIFKTWQARESVYLFLSYLQQLNLIESFCSLIQGVFRSHVVWFKELGIYCWQKIVKN